MTSWVRWFTKDFGLSDAAKATLLLFEKDTATGRPSIGRHAAAEEMIRPNSAFLTPSASNERINRSSDTEGSPLSIVYSRLAGMAFPCLYVSVSALLNAGDGPPKREEAIAIVFAVLVPASSPPRMPLREQGRFEPCPIQTAQILQMIQRGKRRSPLLFTLVVWPPLVD